MRRSIQDPSNSISVRVNTRCRITNELLITVEIVINLVNINTHCHFLVASEDTNVSRLHFLPASSNINISIDILCCCLSHSKIGMRCRNCHTHTTHTHTHMICSSVSFPQFKIFGLSYFQPEGIHSTCVSEWFLSLYTSTLIISHSIFSIHTTYIHRINGILVLRWAKFKQQSVEKLRTIFTMYPFTFSEMQLFVFHVRAHGCSRCRYAQYTSEYCLRRLIHSHMFIFGYDIEDFPPLLVERNSGNKTSIDVELIVEYMTQGKAYAWSLIHLSTCVMISDGFGVLRGYSTLIGDDLRAIRIENADYRYILFSFIFAGYMYLIKYCVFPQPYGPLWWHSWWLYVLSTHFSNGTQHSELFKFYLKFCLKKKLK